MKKYCVARKNKNTETGNGSLTNGWIRMSAWESFDETRRLAELRANDNPNSAIAIFSDCLDRSDNTHWWESRPRYLYNRHVLFEKGSIRAAFGGLINSVESDWL